MTYADHFSRIADRYAAFRPRYPAALVELLAYHAPARDVAWDVGCGSGQLSVALADHFARVIATDLTQEQLDRATPHPRVEYRRATAEASGLDDASIDLVVAAQAAHWFDWPRFVAEVERVARPHAVVALVAYGRLAIDDASLQGCFDDYYDRIAGPYWPRPGRDHIENGYRDLALPWSAIEAPELAMPVTWTREELCGYLSSWSATARLVESEGPGRFEAVCARLAELWLGDEPRAMQFPLIVKLARR
jgi:SAM-dependent methyltransferase